MIITNDLLARVERVTRRLLEPHFAGRACFPSITAQARSSMDDSQVVKVEIVFDGDMRIIDDPLWHAHEWHKTVDDLFPDDDVLVIYGLDKKDYTARDNRYLDERLNALYDKVCKA